MNIGHPSSRRDAGQLFQSLGRPRRAVGMLIGRSQLSDYNLAAPELRGLVSYHRAG